MCGLRLKIKLWLLHGEIGERLDFIELSLHLYAVAQGLEHDTTMFSRRLKHPHFFRGNLGGRLQAYLTLDLLESDGNISINEQGATSVNFPARADFKTHDRNFEPIRNNAQC